MTHRPYMVIYPCGNRKWIDVAYVRDYQEDEWDLVSRQRFDTEEEAKVYAKELSYKHGIPTSFGQSGILDGDDD